MKRMQLYIEPELDRELQRMAIMRGASKAQLIREGVRRMVQDGQPEEPDPILAVVNLVKHTGGRKSNVSEKHDEHLVRWELARTRNKK